MAVTFIWITFYDDQREHRYVPRSQRRFRPGMLAGWLAYLTSWIKKWLTILVTVIHNSYIFTSVGYLLTWLKTHINNAQQSYQKCCHERARRRRVRHTMKDYSHRSRPRRRWSTTVSRRMAILTAMHAVVALSAATPAHGFTAQFDTDSSRVGIDNRWDLVATSSRMSGPEHWSGLWRTIRVAHIPGTSLDHTLFLMVGSAYSAPSIGPRPEMTTTPSQMGHV